jgi:hypothetical protein
MRNHTRILATLTKKNIIITTFKANTGITKCRRLQEESTLPCDY